MSKSTMILLLALGVSCVLCLPIISWGNTLDQTLDQKVQDLKTTVDTHDKQINGSKDKEGLEQKTKQLEGKTKENTDSLEDVRTNLDVADRDLKNVEETTKITDTFLSRFWVLLAAMLVFFMQAGFKCLEVGMARRQHDAATGVMNLMNWLVLCLVFYLAGYAIMFGHSLGGWFGKDFGPPTTEVLSLYAPLGLEHFLFQLAFAATAATIVDGAIAERTSLLPYIFIALVIGLVIYPVFGHWVWNKDGWLWFKWLQPRVKDDDLIKFHDFAGSTVVHSIGAWVALVAVHCVGNRRFRFKLDPDAEKKYFRPYSLGYSVLGVIMLWFGWWGFNGGSELKYDYNIASIILHTNLAGASAGVVAYFDALSRGGKHLHEKLIGGTLGGLVSITASCDVVNPGLAILIGGIAAIIHNWAFDFLINKKVDDVAGAIPVHGACGVWGTFMAGVAVCWKNSDKWGTRDMAYQMLAQCAGIIAAYLFARIVSAIFFLLIERTIGLRTSIAEEDMEIDSGEIPMKEAREYSGLLWVSVHRRLTFWRFDWRYAWSRFNSWEEFRGVRKLSDSDKRNFLDQDLYQFIRDDDTRATEEDIKRMLEKEGVKRKHWMSRFFKVAFGIRVNAKLPSSEASPATLLDN